MRRDLWRQFQSATRRARACSGVRPVHRTCRRSARRARLQTSVLERARFIRGSSRNVPPGVFLDSSCRRFGGRTRARWREFDVANHRAPRKCPSRLVDALASGGRRDRRLAEVASFRSHRRDRKAYHCGSSGRCGRGSARADLASRVEYRCAGCGRSRGRCASGKTRSA